VSFPPKSTPQSCYNRTANYDSSHIRLQVAIHRDFNRWHRHRRYFLTPKPHKTRSYSPTTAFHKLYKENPHLICSYIQKITVQNQNFGFLFLRELFPAFCANPWDPMISGLYEKLGKVSTNTIASNRDLALRHTERVIDEQLFIQDQENLKEIAVLMEGIAGIEKAR
jgi:hypothetical protein